MKQILLITDGCSNVGVSPVVAAAHAAAEDVTVNVVGVLDEQEAYMSGREEIAEVAEAGGGMSRLVNVRQLSQTVQMMTRKTVMTTIQQAVNKELKQVFGADSVEALPPEKRGEVVKVMDELGENSSLRVALLIDASASMKPKLQAVEEAIRDLVLSLQARTGRSEIAVFHFPHSSGSGDCVCDLDWTDNLNGVKRIIPKLPMKGTTPTGPALLQVIDYFRASGSTRKGKHNSETDGMIG